MERRRFLRQCAIVFGTIAGWGLTRSEALAARHGCRRCPHCDHQVCTATPTTIKESKHCWEVNCKTICIPAFKWPWQSCCDTPPCGRVKTIKELKKVEYECERCGYKWDAPPTTCNCGK